MYEEWTFEESRWSHGDTLRMLRALFWLVIVLALALAKGLWWK